MAEPGDAGEDGEFRARFPRPGECIGPYRVTGELGRGGMAVVYAATHLELDAPFALKVLKPEFAREKRIADRFVREARAAARFRHQNIVRATDCGCSRGWYFIAMDYISGQSCEQLLKTQGRLSIGRATRIVRDVAKALDEAGRHRVVHRDVKPANILIPDTGPAKLADLGLIKELAPGERESLTQTGTVLGTPHYMAPEQAEGSQTVDQRADIYSLGATYYHLLTGRAPFSGKSSTEILLKHIREPLPPVRTIKPDVPAWCANIVEKMLAKKPEKRYQSAAELLLDLEEAITRESSRPTQMMESLPRRRSGHRARLIGLSLLSAAILGLLAFALRNVTPRCEQAPVPPPGAAKGREDASPSLTAGRGQNPAPTDTPKRSARLSAKPDQADPAPPMPAAARTPTGETQQPTVPGETPRLAEPLPSAPEEGKETPPQWAKVVRDLVAGGKLMQAVHVCNGMDGPGTAERDNPRTNLARELRRRAEAAIGHTFQETGRWVDHYEFSTPGVVTVIIEDRGAKGVGQDGRFVLQGKTAGPEWKVNGIVADIIDQGHACTASVRFRWPEWRGIGCLVLSVEGDGFSPLIILCQGDGSEPDSDGMGYFMQTRWLDQNSWDLLGGTGHVPLVGNETREFNTMSVALHPNRRNIDFAVGKKCVAAIRVSGKIGRIRRVRCYFQTGIIGLPFRIELDDLCIRQATGVTRNAAKP